MVTSSQEAKQRSEVPTYTKAWLMGEEGFNSEIRIMLLYQQSDLRWSVNVPNWTCMTELCGMTPQVCSLLMSVPWLCFLRCLWSYLSSRYHQAGQSSFTVRARGSEEDRASPGRRDQSEATSAVAGHAPSAAAPSQVDARKVDVLQSGCLSLFWTTNRSLQSIGPE